MAFILFVITFPLVALFDSNLYYGIVMLTFKHNYGFSISKCNECASVFDFIIQEFFWGFPIELEEAARMDGCSVFRT